MGRRLRLWALRQWEVYDNEFIFTAGSNNNPGPGEFPLNMNYLVFIRGGGPGVCLDNKMPNISSSAWGDKGEVKFNLYNIRRRGQVPCQELPPPSAHQIGWGSDASGKMVLSPVYIWGNSGGGNYSNPILEDYNPDECGNNLHTAQFVRKGTEYYVDTPKPGYEPYPYPHPARAAAGGGPTPEPTSTPRPSATPQPTVTPIAFGEPDASAYGNPASSAQTWEPWIKKSERLGFGPTLRLLTMIRSFLAFFLLLVANGRATSYSTSFP